MDMNVSAARFDRPGSEHSVMTVIPASIAAKLDDSNNLLKNKSFR
jgi:hypothetical protein